MVLLLVALAAAVGAYLMGRWRGSQSERSTFDALVRQPQSHGDLAEADLGELLRNHLSKNISDATASRDLGKLVDADLLVPHGEKRGRYYTRSQRLADVWQTIVESRDPKNNRDPFAAAT